ncbi:MAG: hypothetical protein AB7O49_12040 [Sphingomonadales bacterium]
MPVRLALNHFESDPSLEQRDGVNLAHTEITRLLAAAPHPGLDVTFHDFDRLLRDAAYARDILGPADCVLANVGPHAHYYHYLRQRLGLGFRIVRDIKTAIWSSYLLQESLCAPYLRPGDVLLATSHYSRVLTRHLFPHLQGAAIHLFEPVLAAPGDSAGAPPVHPPMGETVTLGYVGRLSEDKNFPQTVDLLIALDREEPGRYRLVACGAVHSPSCDPAAIAARVEAETGRPGLFEYRPPVPYDRVLPMMREFDYLLFFSTSNLEVLGRVLIEVAHEAVPVLAADHAAAPELLARSSLIDVAYDLDRPFHSHFDAPMGRVDLEMAAGKIRRREVPDPPPAPRVNHADEFIDILLGREPAAPCGGTAALHPAQQRFVARLRPEDLPRFASVAEAHPVIEEMLGWFRALNGKAAPDFSARLADLEARSRFPERTRRFIAQADRTRCDYTNLGGIDIELCNIAGYHPRFSLTDPPGQAPREALALDRAAP